MLLTTGTAPANAIIDGAAATKSCTKRDATKPALQQGDSGSCITPVLTDYLEQNGFKVEGANGHFGPATKAQVVAFQNAKNLQSDGVVGPATWAALEHKTVYSMSHGPNYTKRVVFSYDDCPKTLTATIAMLKAAQKNDIGLWLFPTGDCVSRFKRQYNVNLSAMMRQYEQWVGNHSNTHPNLTTLSSEEIKQELGTPGVQTNFGRPPGGAHNSRVDKVYKTKKMQEVLWTDDSNDWRTNPKTGRRPSHREIEDFVIENAQPRDMFLMHMQHAAFNPASMLRMKRELAKKHIGVCRAYSKTTPRMWPSKVPC
jgi:peptidoglycan/xylan/chitin deacetylase (PgdA/CDA1 family)